MQKRLGIDIADALPIPAHHDLTMNAHSDAILARCATMPPALTAVVHPVKANVLEAVEAAVRANLIIPVLIGPREKIEAAAAAAGVDVSKWEIIEAEHSHAAADKAAMLAASQHVAVIMKGSLHTDELLAAIIGQDGGLRTERRISHAYLMSLGSYPKPFIITDAAINIMPNLTIKADIVQNAVDLWHVVFGKQTLAKVAVLAAVETVNPKMIATIDAAALCKMADRGQIEGGVLDGPLAFDNAMSAEAARVKGIVSPVAGSPDILVAPDIEAGNMLYKQLVFFTAAFAAGIVLGAKVPVILTSRADNRTSRIASCAVAQLMARAHP